MLDSSITTSFDVILWVAFIKLKMQAEKVSNQYRHFKKTVKYVGEPMTHLESIASSAVIALEAILQFRLKFTI